MNRAGIGKLKKVLKIDCVCVKIMKVFCILYTCIRGKLNEKEAC